MELPPPSALGFADEAAFITCTLVEAINASKRRYRQEACPRSGTQETDEEELFDVRLVPGGGARRIGRGEIEPPEEEEKKEARQRK